MTLKHSSPVYRFTPKSLHIDWVLLSLLLAVVSIGLVILYSASNQDNGMVFRQTLRLGFAFLVMFFLAFIPPHKYKLWTPWIYGIGFSLLIAVIGMGKIGKGAQRWLDLGLFRFQPSEIMKIAVPLMASWYLDKVTSKVSFRNLIIVCLIIFVPALLIAKQPDLGTGIIVACAGLSVVFMAGLSMQVIFAALTVLVVSAPLLWHVLHDYQKHRIITFLNPENDPLGTGYHIIQSKIAIGSGGVIGKGWQQGSQSHLNFLPEHATDFIFAVNGEEFGFTGGLVVILLMVIIAFRGLHIAHQAQTSFTRLLAASLSITFFLSAFINIGMVMGILPVVGVPLPLISYGGTAMVTFLAGFGIIMSISTHRILFNQP